MTCNTPHCTNKPRAGKKFCHKCRNIKYRAANPMRAAFQALKDNAKRRGIFFDLTYQQFAQFCYETNYIAGKGRSSLSYSIDRITDGKTPGYTISNIQKVTVRFNSQKEQARRKNKTLIYDYNTGYATVI